MPRWRWRRCSNVVEPQSSGIAGNGFVTYFDKATGAVHSLSMAGAAPKGLKVAAR